MEREREREREREMYYHQPPAGDFWRGIIKIHTLLANACMHLCRQPACPPLVAVYVLAAAAAASCIIYVSVYICVCVGILMMLHWRSRAIYPTQISSAIFLTPASWVIRVLPASR